MGFTLAQRIYLSSVGARSLLSIKTEAVVMAKDRVDGVISL